ncbi:MAG: RNA methyltransferase [Xanthomonadales bacterium]|nr:RNA methyltransferase [Xanthomonadales bacterium]
MSMLALLPRIRVVLVATSQPGNIGSAARAMKVMGLQRLALVAPRAFPHPEATALAAGSDDLLARAQVLPDLETAIADCHFVLGASARRRGVSLPELSPRQAAQALLPAAGQGEVALVFGAERTGLSNEELQRCHACVRIATDPDYSSLNLAQAVQVLAYELRLAAEGGAGAEAADADASPRERPASSAEMERFFRHLDQALRAIDFHKGKDGVTITHRLRRLFLRAAMSEREVAILHGVLSDAERMAALASAVGESPGPDDRPVST